MAKAKIQPVQKKRTPNWHAAANVETNKRYVNSSEAILEYSSFLPVIFQSPYIDTDLQIFEGIYANTLIGRAIDIRVDFAVARGVCPSFVLKDKSIKDPKEKQAKLDTYQDYIRELEAIDNSKQIQLSRKCKGLLRNMHIFGRSVLAMEDGIKGEHDPEIPIALKLIHPRDLGRVFVHQLDWSVSSVYAFQKTQLLKSEEMIYLAQFPDSPIRRSMNYGYSSIQRLMGQARALRRINEFDIPQAVEAAWAKYPTITVDQDGMTEGEKTADLTTVRNGWKAGAINIISGKKDDFNYFNVDSEPKLAELGEIKDNVERDSIGLFGVPTGVFGREADQTRATFLGKMQFFRQGPVEEDRRILSEVLADQWYERNLKILGHENILEDVKVEVTFEPIIIESWTDNIDAVLKLKGNFPIPNDELLRMLNLEDLIPKLEKEKMVDGENVISPDNIQKMKDDTNPEKKEPV